MLNSLWQRKGVGLTLVLAGFFLLALQWWRPLFFLTDDSFSLTFPVWVSVGQKLWAAQNPFVMPELFGGAYPFYRDPLSIVLWHPLALLLSLLSPTFFRNGLVDILASLDVLLAAAGFRWMISQWTRAGLARISGGAAVFLSLSYSFSMYSLLMGSSGFWYLANVAALPWLAGAWWEKSPKRLFWVVVPAAFHNAVGGYASCFVYSMALIMAMGIWKVWMERDFRLLVRYVLALGVAGLLCLPMMLPSLAALADSTRGGAIPVGIASEHRVPFPVLAASAFLGSGSLFFGHFELFGKMVHAYALASFAAGGWVLAAFWRKKGFWNRWDFCLVVLLGAAALLISRPHWLGVLLQQVPVLGSLRWPHKEVFLWVFILHLWAARGSSLGARPRNLMGFGGVLIFLASLILAGPPSLNEHRASRDLLLSGQADRFWVELKGRLRPGEQIVPLMPDGLAEDLPRYFQVPLIVTGGGNFPAMYGVKSWSGYSATMPNNIFERQPQPVAVIGIYARKDMENLSEVVPGAVFLELVEENPLRILLQRKGSAPELAWAEKEEGRERRRPESNR